MENLIKTKRSIAATLGLALISVTIIGHAEEYSATVGTELIYTDNARKRSKNVVSDTLASANAAVNYSNETELLDASFGYQGRFETYQNNSFEDKAYLDGRGRVNFKILPKRLSWSVSHDQRTQTIDNIDSNTPDNTDSRTIWQTGPAIELDLGPVDSISINAQYIDIRYDESQEQDSERYNGDVKWSHQVSALWAVSLVGGYSETEFDRSELEYDQTRYGLEIFREFKRGSVRLEAGADEIDRTDGEKFDGNYVNASADFEFSGSMFGLRYIQELSDTSSGLGLNNSLAGEFDSGEANSNIVDVIDSESFQAFYKINRESGRSSLNLSLYQYEEDYQTSPRDERRMGVRGEYGYKFNEYWSSLLSVHYSQTDRDDMAGSNKYNEMSLGFKLDYNAFKNLRISSGIEYVNRTNEQLASSEYTVMEVSIGVYYLFGPSL